MNLMENPAGQGGAPVVSLAPRKIDTETNRTQQELQARRLCRLFVMSRATAFAIAEMVYAGGPR